MYRIKSVLKAEMIFITRITLCLIGRTVILVIIYVETFKTADIAFIDNVIMCLTSH